MRYLALKSPASSWFRLLRELMLFTFKERFEQFTLNRKKEAVE